MKNNTPKLKSGKTAPLLILKEAVCRLKELKLENNVPEEARLRVKSFSLPGSGTSEFDMFFDTGFSAKEDMCYPITSGLSIILDNNTAYQLVGSEMRLDDEGQFKFTHLETVAQVTAEGKNHIIYN